MASVVIHSIRVLIDVREDGDIILEVWRQDHDNATIIADSDEYVNSYFALGILRHAPFRGKCESATRHDVDCSMRVSTPIRRIIGHMQVSS